MNWNAANFVVLAVTCLVLVIYTIETYRLRKAAQKQIETSIMPIVVFRFDRAFSEKRDAWGQGGVPFPVVRNIGFGPAFNLEISPITNGTTSIQFQEVPLLAADQKEMVSPEGYTGDGASLELVTANLYSILTHKTNPAESLVRLPVRISYLNANGRRLSAIYEIESDPAAGILKTTLKELSS